MSRLARWRSVDRPRPGHLPRAWRSRAGRRTSTAFRSARAAAWSFTTPFRSTPSTTSRLASARRVRAWRGARRRRSRRRTAAADDRYVTLDGERVTLAGPRADAHQDGGRAARDCAPRRSCARASSGADSVFNAPTRTPGVSQVTIAGPFKPSGPGDTPSRRRLLVCAPQLPADETALREDDSWLARVAARIAVPSRSAVRRWTRCSSSTATAPRAGTFESGLQRAVARVLVDPQFLFRFERDPVNVARRRAVPAQRRRAGVAALVLSVEQHSRR